jgi:hypothetical protein
VRIVRYRVPVEATALLNERTGTVFELPPEFEPLLELLDGRRTVADLAAAFTLSSRGDGALGSFTRDVLLESLPRLLDGLVQQGFLAPTNVGA